MSIFSAKDIRNVVLLGHSGCGKTSMVEAILAKSGAIPRMGSIADGDTVSDYNEDERVRKCSISSSLISLNYSGKKINWLDIPGYTDFIGEMIGGLRAADTIIVVVDATAGVEIGAEKAQRMTCEKGVPSVFFINKIDKEHSDFGKCIDGITKKFRKSCVLVGCPIGRESSFRGVANLITRDGMDTLQGDDKVRGSSLWTRWSAGQYLCRS